MDLRPFVDNVRRELAVAAEVGGDEARAMAERLSAPLASAIRLTLLDALSAAADEITQELAPGSVEVRLRAGEATFATTTPPSATGKTAETPEEPAEDDAAMDGAMTRINVRLPEALKARVEEAAAAEGRSVNAWLVRAATAALRPAATTPPATATGQRSAQHYTGWVR